MHCTISCDFMDDEFASRAAVVSFTTRAKTRRGLLRATAKAIVEKLHTDVFDVGRNLLCSDVPDKWGNPVALTAGERNEIWRMGHDLMLGRE